MPSSQCKAVLLDIEGTTTSISFVKDTLFPYAIDNVESYLEKNWDKQECVEIIEDLIDQANDDVTNNIEGVSLIPSVSETSNKRVRECVVDYVKLLIAKDRKVTPLKELQGLIWSQAYENGSIKGHVFPDVSDSLANWFKRRIKIYIYSSGSVKAQELLFGNSEAGNLLRYISGHFDTCIGHKRDSTSYSKIADKIGIPPKQILFLTDIPEEAHAAIEVGVQAMIVVRPGNKELTLKEIGSLQKISSLDDLVLHLCTEVVEKHEESPSDHDIPPVKKCSK